MKLVNCLAADDSNLMHQVMRMYDEEFTDAQLLDQGVSVDDTEAIAILESSTIFVNGHFVVPLPWKKSVNTGMGNYASVLSRLNSLKRRLINDEAPRFRYVQTMKTTIEKGYAVPVPGEQLHCDFHPRWYLPHHAVLNPKKPEKLRIFLGYASKHKGQSLNDMLYQGLDTTVNLVGIHVRFRKECVAVTADIEEMFIQRRWMREYTPTLQMRQKWLSKHRNFKSGDIVLMASEITTRGKWPMGIINAVETDGDGLVRMAVVHTVGGKIRR
ncbi:unnamed protein product [Echinostoma caproni]|uniref:DUF5641 domain-containing protein n=1 Tax=Echinostoma caproni TaxID=27848 RepID=A0A183AN05_9TREM|nr:unnamed protein product [Echinostoma caproni]